MAIFRYVTIVISLLISPILLAILLTTPKGDPIIGRITPSPDVVPMPLVYNPEAAQFTSLAPNEQRGIEHRKYLSPSLKIKVQGASGSGTIIFYDQKGYAYVISCGHLWNGTRTADQTRGIKCQVETWYKNNEKLNQSQTFEAEVLFWSNNRGYDCSLLRFKPDWKPNYFPIAPVDYYVSPGSRQHSVGCDGGREVAHYDVTVIGMRGDDLVTKDNSPRPGRSGGGLISNDGFYIGICWGTSDTVSGGGVGYFTPLENFRRVFNQNGFEWLLNIPRDSAARLLPIIDQQNPQSQYQPEFIPLPND